MPWVSVYLGEAREAESSTERGHDVKRGEWRGKVKRKEKRRKKERAKTEEIKNKRGPGHTRPTRPRTKDTEERPERGSGSGPVRRRPRSGCREGGTGAIQEFRLRVQRYCILMFRLHSFQPDQKRKTRLSGKR
jgi:hypothetical protein